MCVSYVVVYVCVCRKEREGVSGVVRAACTVDMGNRDHLHMQSTFKNQIFIYLCVDTCWHTHAHFPHDMWDSRRIA